MEKIMVFAIVFGSIIWILVKIFNMFMDPVVGCSNKGGSEKYCGKCHE